MESPGRLPRAGRVHRAGEVLTRLKILAGIVCIVVIELHRERLVAAELRIQDINAGVNEAITHINARFEQTNGKLLRLEELNDIHWGHSPGICRDYSDSLKRWPPKLPPNIIEHPQHHYPPPEPSPLDSSSVVGVR